MVLLAVESENGAVLTYRFAKAQISVGSSSRNDVVVHSPGVAERHLVIHRNNGVFTFVTVDRQTVVLNGEKRSRGVMNPGDRIRIGATTLVFRGQGAPTEEVVEETPAEAPAKPVPAAESVESLTFRSDPAGFPEARRRIIAVFDEGGSDRLRQLVAVLREALPDAEIAISSPGEGDVPMALASVWTGELPRMGRRALGDLVTPGRYALVSTGSVSTAAIPVLDRRGDVSAVITARPAGALGDEGVALLFEVSRLLGLRWREVERDDTSFSGWELEARHRLDALLPGSSQAVQVLRTGMLAAAHGNEPVLICGAAGTGRTEVARILATLGPVAGRAVLIFDGREADIDVLRQELFGPSGHPSFGPEAAGIVGRARGGVLVARNVDLLPISLQSELSGLIAAQQREPLSTTSTRWFVTCGEDPLALVQQGKLSSALLMGFSQRMLRVPRLAERREDMPLLIAALLRRAASEQRKNLRGITLECLNQLLAQAFPGEMSDLVGEINRLVTATPDGEMVRCDIGGPVMAALPSGGELPTELMEVLTTDNLKDAIPRIEQVFIDRVMRRVKGNQSKGARLLGISRGALITKLKEYGIPDYRYLRRQRGGSR